MSELDRESSIRDVLALGDRGRSLLLEHGFDPGLGFVDVLSQYQSLETAARGGQIRDLDGLVAKLNFDSAPRNR